jgi:hypothetical protein
LGAVFAKTEHIRKENEEKLREATIQSLLGYGTGVQKPGDLKIFDVHRYVITDEKGNTVLGYMLPLKDKGFALVEIDWGNRQVIPVNADLPNWLNGPETCHKRPPKGPPPRETLSIANPVTNASAGGPR